MVKGVIGTHVGQNVTKKKFSIFIEIPPNIGEISISGLVFGPQNTFFRTVKFSFGPSLAPVEQTGLSAKWWTCQCLTYFDDMNPTGKINQ